MAPTNHDRVGRALDLLRDGLRSYVEREMRVEFGEGWQVEATSSRIRPNRDGKIVWDLANLLKLVWDQWNTVFGQKLAREHRAARERAYRGSEQSRASRGRQPRGPRCVPSDRQRRASATRDLCRIGSLRS